MLKLSIQNIISIVGISLFLSLIGAAPGFAQDLGKTGVFYRVANLCPLGTPMQDVYLGEKPLALQTKPGFYMGYTPFDFKPGSTVSLKSGDQNLQSVQLPSGKSTKFFTFLIVSDGSRPKLEILDDTLPEKEDEMSGEKMPVNRLRVFSGAYKIPIKIEAGDLLTWTSKNGDQLLNSEKIFDYTKTNSIKVTYLGDQNLPVDLFFPLDFINHKGNTVFISQRGPQRLRVISYPDAVAPVEETPTDLNQ